MTLVQILLGLAGLGIVVFFHELGHFLVARLVGVEVEAFSLGWGPKLVWKRMGNTEYRISAIPIGGYCKMRGEDAFQNAVIKGDTEIPAEPGTYFGTSPWKRILISLGGPAFNVVFSFAVFALVFGMGYSENFHPGRIGLVSELEGASGRINPADKAGLRTGDRIVSIDEEPILTFNEIVERVGMAAEKDLAVVVERGGERLDLTLRPALDSESGAGRIGVYAFVEPVVGSVVPGSPAALSGFRKGDRIDSIDDKPVRNGEDLSSYIRTARPESARIVVSRDGLPVTLSLVLDYDEKGATIPGIEYAYETRIVKASGFVDALGRGADETGKTVYATLKGMATLFKGINVLKAVSGPARITYMVGQVAASGFREGIVAGLSMAFNFLAFLSIGLFVMNLLPIPVLDGGWIVLFLIEGVRGKQVQVKTIMRYQTVGVFIIAGIFLLSTFADILFFSGK